MKKGQLCDWCDKPAKFEKNGDYACADHKHKLNQDGGWRD